MDWIPIYKTKITISFSQVCCEDELISVCEALSKAIWKKNLTMKLVTQGNAELSWSVVNKDLNPYTEW